MKIEVPPLDEREYRPCNGDKRCLHARKASCRISAAAFAERRDNPLAIIPCMYHLTNSEYIRLMISLRSMS